jgi:hypothetical protein
LDFTSPSSPAESVLEPACSSLAPSVAGFSVSSPPLLLPESLLLVLELPEAAALVPAPVPFTDPSLLTFGGDEPAEVVVFGVDADSLHPANHSATPVSIRVATNFFNFTEKHIGSTFAESL